MTKRRAHRGAGPISPMSEIVPLATRVREKRVSKLKLNFVPGSAFVAMSLNKVISCLSADTTNYPSVRTQYSLN
jgi:hypothetical protein